MYLAIVIQLSIIYYIQSVAQTDTKGACGCCTPGIPGIPGNHGTAGASGPVGMAGIKGDRGLHGDTGLKGDKGTNGKNGTGLPGKLGPIGIQGPAGINGLEGAKGETGLTGATGETGLTGATGETGLQGVTGEKGERGEKGEQASAISKAKSAFSVAFKASPGRLPIGPMKYETIITNIGNDYSKETGKFTCQHPGTYVFQFTAQKNSSGSSITTNIIKNGLITVSAYEGFGSKSGGSASNMVILDLIESDQVWTRPLSSTENYYHSNSNAFCSFSGFLLYKA